MSENKYFLVLKAVFAPPRQLRTCQKNQTPVFVKWRVNEEKNTGNSAGREETMQEERKDMQGKRKRQNKTGETKKTIF